MSKFLRLVKAINRDSRKLTRINFEYVVQYSERAEKENETTLVLHDGKTIHVLESTQKIDDLLSEK